MQRNQAVQIPQEVRQKVEKRDSWFGHPCCILCGSPRGKGNAHVVPRSDNGMGIEENIVTLCWECHTKYDNSEHRGELRDEIVRYLKKYYPNWNEDDMRYKKCVG